MTLHISTRFGVTNNTNYYTCQCIFGRVQEPVNHEKQMAIYKFVMLLIHLKSWKIHLIFRFKQCVCNSMNFFLVHEQNKAKLRCTSHLFNWNSAIGLAVICDPDSTVRWVYTPEIESAPSGELIGYLARGLLSLFVFVHWATTIYRRIKLYPKRFSSQQYYFCEGGK